MKIAFVHDWLDTWAGGELVLRELLQLWPEAPVFTLVDFFDDAMHARLGARDIRPSFIQGLPFARTRFRRYLPLFPRAVERFDVAAFDVVVSVSHAVAKGARTHPGQLNLCYCLSPMRYAWDLREQYLDQVGLGGGPGGVLVNRILDRIAAWDVRASARVDEFIAISHHIADRIRRSYAREASVLYPPVNVGPPPPAVPREAGLYVTVSRLVPYKRIDLIAAAFRDLPGRTLVIVGEGPERDRVAREAGPNVRLAGLLDDAGRDRLLARAQAFLFAADEDFGIAPLEAHAFGTPVIGFRRGGLTETVRGLEADHPTGVFFDEQTPQAIVRAVLDFEAHRSRIVAAACRENAEKFAAPRFRAEFAAHVEARWSDFRASRASR